MMKNKIKIILLGIGGLFLAPIIVAKIFSWYWKWNGFVLNLAFDASGWESEDLILVKAMLCFFGILAMLILGASITEIKEK